MRRILKYIIYAFLIIFYIDTFASGEMEVTTWDPGCEHTMTTNHFDLSPGQSVEIPVDLSGCGKAPTGLLIFGYHTTKNSSRQLTQKDNVRFTLDVMTSDQDTIQTLYSDSGALYVDLGNVTNTTFTIRAQNISKNKEITVRLRSQAIW